MNALLDAFPFFSFGLNALICIVSFFASSLVKVARLEFGSVTGFEADDAFTFVRPRTRLLRRRLDVEDTLRHLEALFPTVKRRSGALVDDIGTN